ncbi:dehydrogenase/reductase SDR family member on chromosome X-like isoform X2 [Sinocyclocheilus anshuiensis]|uniref:dehydrogenase/reductase SDR family member on chromosome X-like isoform X2 n=1 Tax=Sinocyclocheilus anshuiensis TaxID=1608454 RepID=UPI0007B81BD7|nr:PREDICTED: dehydrogenase/reductase SDR family member on chromosome X-like isoform X2 [Sinocyclocheilus anshuiensis]
MWWLLPCILGFVRLYLDGVKVLLYQLFNRSFILPDLPKQNGKVAIVTGGARGMGYEISRHLASLDMHVVIAGNEEHEGLAAVKKIREELNQGKAGIMLVPERRTEDGFELHFGLNYLGHFLLTNLLLDVLKKSGKPGKCSRIVIMSSATHYGGRLTLDDLQGRMCYSAHGAYAQSKLALLLFSYHLQDQLWVRGDPVTVNAVDPGMVDTALYDNLSSPAQLAKKPFAKLLFRTPAEGASTAIYAAAASELKGIGGLYLYNGRKTESSALSYDQQLQTKLWKESCALVGLQ